MDQATVFAMAFCSILSMRLHPRNVPDVGDRAAVLREVSFAHACARQVVATALEEYDDGRGDRSDS